MVIDSPFLKWQTKKANVYFLFADITCGIRQTVTGYGFGT
jgi:hypothetical protein